MSSRSLAITRALQIVSIRIINQDTMHICALQERSPYLLHQQGGKFVNMCRLARAFAARILIDFSLTVKAATLLFISGRGLAISCAKEEKSG